jgi:glycosyltransferase involved in cell wall biosynthesis
VNRRAVAFFIDHLGVGGVQEFLLNFCKARRDSTDITIISLFSNDIYSSLFRKAGASVVFLNKEKYSYTSVLNIKSFFRFRAFYRRNNSCFDDIHLKLFATFAYAAMMRLWKDPRISSGLDANRNQLPFPVQALFWVFARHYQRFYLNVLLWNDYAGFGLRSPRLRNQTYPVTRRHSDTPRLYPAKFSFLSVGRGILQKGHAEAVALFKLTQSLLDGNACLTILGEGPAIDALRIEHPAHNGNKIDFPGSVANYDDWLIGASAVIRMAVGEDTNSVIREALLAGKLVATTLEGPGCISLAEQGLAIAIDRNDLPGSAARLASAVRGITAEKSVRLRLSAEELWPEENAFSAYD